nr:zinc finger, CCHC-type [Tanacetum cinerariifolium]
MSVVYVLTTPMPEDGGENPTMDKSGEEPSRTMMIMSAEEELTLIELGSHLRIKESLRVQDSDKPKGNNVAGPSVVNMVEHNNSSRDCKGGNVSNKANGSGTKGLGDGSFNHLKVAINSITESKDAIFDEHKFSLVLRPSQRSLKDRAEDSGGLVVFERVIEETFGLQMDFQKKLKVDETVERLLIAMASTHNLIIHQMDVKTAFLNEKLEKEKPKQWHQKFDEVVLFNGYLLNQADKCVYSKIDGSGKRVIICLYVDDMVIFGTDQVQVDLTKELFSLRFSMKDIGEADVIIVSTSLDTCEKLMPNKGPIVSQLKYSRVIGCLMYVMTCTRPDIAFAIGKLSSNSKDNSSTSGWVFLLGGGAISWASKKQTCITGSIMESEFMALAVAGKEAEWLENLLLEISLWVVAPISIRYDSVATLSKAYIQMYNGKSRHLGVRHSIIRELITNGMVSIEFVRS